MHELGIAQAFLGATIEAAGERRVCEVHVGIGTLNGVVDDSLAFGFELLAEGTPAAGAALTVRVIRARTRCSDCSEEHELRAMPPVCAGCGSMSVTFVAGRELILEEVVLAGDPPERMRVGVEVDEQADGHTHDHHHHDHGNDQRHDVLAMGTVRAGSWPFD